MDSAVSLAALLASYCLFMPEAFLAQGAWPALRLQPWFFTLWAILNLGLWLYFVREWLLVWRFCRRPSGRLGLA